MTKSMLEQNSNSNSPHGILSLSTDETGLSAMETPLGAVQTPMRARRPEKQKLLSKSKNLLQKSRKPHSNGAQNNDMKYGERLQNMQNLESENVNPSRGMRGGAECAHRPPGLSSQKPHESYKSKLAKFKYEKVSKTHLSPEKKGEGGCGENGVKMKTHLNPAKKGEGGGAHTTAMKNRLKVEMKNKPCIQLPITQFANERNEIEMVNPLSTGARPKGGNNAPSRMKTGKNWISMFLEGLKHPQKPRLGKR